MLTVGDGFPSFMLIAVQGGPQGLDPSTAFTEITDWTDAGKWKLVFFWPEDFAFGCPTEIVGLGTLHDGFADRFTVVYGVSTDSEFGRNPQEVMRVPDALQSDALCPCNWTKG